MKKTRVKTFKAVGLIGELMKKGSRKRDEMGCATFQGVGLNTGGLIGELMKKGTRKRDEMGCVAFQGVGLNTGGCQTVVSPFKKAGFDVFKTQTALKKKLMKVFITVQGRD